MLEVPPDYQPLYKYLASRFADTLTLTFVQIEDLLGRPLPAGAYSEQEWWISPAAVGAPSPQSSAWAQAKRIATANLAARTVMFDRA